NTISKRDWSSDVCSSDLRRDLIIFPIILMLDIMNRYRKLGKVPICGTQSKHSFLHCEVAWFNWIYLFCLGYGTDIFHRNIWNWERKVPLLKCKITKSWNRQDLEHQVTHIF